MTDTPTDDLPTRPDVEKFAKLAFERAAVFGRLCDAGVTAEKLTDLCDYILALERRAGALPPSVAPEPRLDAAALLVRSIEEQSSEASVRLAARSALLLIDPAPPSDTPTDDRKEEMRMELHNNDYVIFTDESGNRQHAIVTHVWDQMGGDTLPPGCNLAFLATGATEPTEHSSVPHLRHVAGASGFFWRWPHEDDRAIQSSPFGPLWKALHGRT